jgi:hypothetical protein
MGTKPILLFIPNQPLCCQGKSLDYILAHFVGIISEEEQLKGS